MTTETKLAFLTQNLETTLAHFNDMAATSRAIAESSKAAGFLNNEAHYNKVAQAYEDCANALSYSLRISNQPTTETKVPEVTIIGEADDPETSQAYNLYIYKMEEAYA